MTKQSMILGIAALAVAGSILVPSVLAYKGDPKVQGPNYSVERHEAMEKAFETNNYNAWKSLMEGKTGRVTQVVNASNFSKFAKAHELAEQGKLAEAQAIRKELGLGLKNGSGQGKGANCNR
jgi:hypothetical protein